jgi:predicted oxidoreductase
MREKLAINLPTCRATSEEKTRLNQYIKKIGFERPTDFWRRCMQTLFAQVSAGQKLKWPLEFAVKQNHDLELKRNAAKTAQSR